MKYLYFKCCLMIFWVALHFGFLWPWLISAKSHILVSIGFLESILVFPLLTVLYAREIFTHWKTLKGNIHELV
jgi:hypothetical protein